MDKNSQSKTSQSNTPSRNDSPFFVGYLPMPSSLRWLYWPLGLALVLACGYAGFSVARHQAHTHPSYWSTAATTTYHGILTRAPYAVLHRPDASHPLGVESVMLVRHGKHAADLPARFEGQAVAVSGNVIARGGWRMLEISGADALEPSARVAPGALAARLDAKPLGAVALRGEIADSKCFLGVMKPGAGRIHKACAEVCLRGGVPPMLIAQDAQQRRFGYLLVGADGASASTRLAPFAAELVEVRGQLHQRGDLLYITLDEDGVERL
ncbi:MAG: hypothetical protein ACR2P7_01585 [bacterium]